jgi:hypothetical protein
MPVSFKCAVKVGRRIDRWTGIILKIIKYGSHNEIRIESLSSITVIFGKTSLGGFACMPDFEAGCHLGDPTDVAWNTEELTAVLGKIDGITVAEALYALSDKKIL